MRIAILNHGFPPDVGGGETQAYITALTLQARGHSVHVFTGGVSDRLIFPFPVSYLQHYKAFEKGEEGPKYFVKELKDALTAAGQFDVLYCSNFSALQAASYMREILPIKTVFTFHCVPAEEQRKVIGYFDDWELEKSFVRHILEAAQPEMTVCPSSFFYEWARAFGLPEDRLRIVYNSVILSDFAYTVSAIEQRKFREENGLPSNAFLFLTPARMLAKKGIYELVQAAQKAPASAYFYVVSSLRNANPEFLKRIRKLIHEQGLGGRIKLCFDQYSVTEMPKLYQLCDTMLLPSHHEGLPVTILEAMASKKLVACTDIPALKELVKHRVNGMMCRPKDAGSLSRMITRIVNMEPERRQKIAEAGYKTVCQKGDADKNIRLLETIFAQA